MRRFLFDTSIFIYALGGEHLYKEPCREIVRKAAAEAARNVAKLAWWHPVEPNDIQRGIDLFEIHPNLDARDAVFAALAINRGIDTILSTDRAFDGINELKRIDPADEQAVARLVG